MDQYYPYQFREDILVYIEFYDKRSGNVLFDFIDSNEFNGFNNILNLSVPLKTPLIQLGEHIFCEEITAGFGGAFEFH